MTRLIAADFNFARAHISYYYDSDFYPRAFEYKAIWALWPRCLEYLVATDIETMPAPAPRLYAAPKPGGDFRVVHQLDPIATIVYTALARRLAPYVEAARPPVQDAVACAYRIAINDERGGFFGDNTGYEQFLGRCRELATTFSHVLVADIADFYNQVYLHRLQNALAVCHADAGTYSTAVEDYLIATNGGVSKGLPVGPAASIIMAEACLIDVDNMIRRPGFALTRYVDDIRVFSDSPEALTKLLQDLTLYAHHRLSLAGAKTKIVPSNTFIEHYIDDPALVEMQAAHERLNTAEHALVADAASFAAQAPPDRDGPPEPEVILELIQQLCGRPTLNMGLARHILRKCRKYRVRAIIPPLLDHFSFFAPVISDVILYLRRVSSPAFITRNSHVFADLCRNAPALRLPFVRHWVDGYMAGHAELLSNNTIRAHVQDSPSFAAQAQCARTLRDVAWVRSQKQNIANHGPTERRELYRTSTVLAREERNTWLRRMARNESYILDQLVIDWVLSQ